MQRSHYRLKSIIKYATHKGFTDIIILAEHHRRPCGMYICHLPEGPTSFFKLTNVKLARDMKGSAALTTHHPEVILNNFTTRLGRRAARQLAVLFPQVLMVLFSFTRLTLDKKAFLYFSQRFRIYL